MRIIDKNTDFYDYWQNIYIDRSTTFDRTDSFLLTKSMLCDHLYWIRSRFHTWRDEPQVFVLLQICHTFWLFLLEVTQATDEYDRPKDYTVELVTTWKNYDKQRALLKLDVVRFSWDIYRLLGFGWNLRKVSSEMVISRANDLIQAVNSGNYDIERSIDKHTIYKGDGTKIEKHIPLLKACGIAACIDPLEVYLAFEEYFSLEKSSLERTASVGLTNEEKIGNHGFDMKTSFRGN